MRHVKLILPVMLLMLVLVVLGYYHIFKPRPNQETVNLIAKCTANLPFSDSQRYRLSAILFRTIRYSAEFETDNRAVFGAKEFEKHYADYIDCVGRRLEIPTTQLRIVVSHVDIHNDCDGGLNGVGDWYYEFRVDGQEIAGRSPRKPIGVGDGGILRINKSALVDKYEIPGEKLRLTGFLYDSDSGGPDMAIDDFDRVLTSKDKWGVGSYSQRFRNDGCDVTLHYRIEKPR